MLDLTRRALLLAASGAGLAPASAMKAFAATGPRFELGVQTHFSQNWPLSAMARAKSVGATSLRDGLSWGAVETKPGRYDFDAGRGGYLEQARKSGLRVLLTIVPRNALYDGGATALSDPARTAYADYLSAVLARYGDVVWGVEVGNELNTSGGVTGPAAANRATSHVALLRTVWDRVKPAHPNVQIVGGSVNVIGVGFLQQVFAAGGLQVMDAVAVHPYRSFAEHVDEELAAVREVMRGHGPERPIYATEFSDSFATPELASPHMIKMLALMGAAGVRWSSWYALDEERFFPGMGLFDGGRMKPAAESFAFAQRALLPFGAPTRVELGPRVYAFRYPGGPWVIWGAPRPLKLSGPVKAFDARGRAIATPAAIGPDPVVLTDVSELSLGPSAVVADSFYDFGGAPWSYFAQTPDGKLHPLKRMDWEWTSYIGERFYKPLRFNADALAPAGAGKSAIHAVLRYTAPAAQAVKLRLTLSPSGKGDGVDMAIAKNGAPLRTVLVNRRQEVEFDLSLAARDTVDFNVGPNLQSGGDVLGYRVQVTA